MDSDDWFDLDGFEALLNILSARTTDLVITPSFNYLEKTQKIVPMPFPKNCTYEKEMPFDELCKKTRGFFRMSTMTFRTEMLQKGKIQIDTCFYTDMELVCFPLSDVCTVYIGKTPVYVARVGRPDQSTALQSLEKHIPDIEQVAVSTVRWYKDQRKNSLSAERDDYYQRIVKYVISAYFRQTFTSNNEKDTLLWCAKLKCFREQILEDAHLSQRKYYSMLAYILIKTNFVSYKIIQKVWRKTHKL